MKWPSWSVCDFCLFPLFDPHSNFSRLFTTRGEGQIIFKVIKYVFKKFFNLEGLKHRKFDQGQYLGLTWSTLSFDYSDGPKDNLWLRRIIVLWHWREIWILTWNLVFLKSGYNHSQYLSDPTLNCDLMILTYLKFLYNLFALLIYVSASQMHFVWLTFEHNNFPVFWCELHWCNHRSIT